MPGVFVARCLRAACRNFFRTVCVGAPDTLLVTASFYPLLGTEVAPCRSGIRRQAKHRRPRRGRLPARVAEQMLTPLAFAAPCWLERRDARFPVQGLRQANENYRRAAAEIGKR